MNSRYNSGQSAVHARSRRRDEPELCDSRHQQMIGGMAWQCCYLVRHGDALSATDRSRATAVPAGREEVDRLARMALDRNVQVGEICHSGIRRARETAEILASYLMPPRRCAAMLGFVAGRRSGARQSRVGLVDEPVMWVGHLPYMNRLAGLLVAAPEQRVGIYTRDDGLLQPRRRTLEIGWNGVLRGLSDSS